MFKAGIESVKSSDFSGNPPGNATQRPIDYGRDLLIMERKNFLLDMLQDHQGYTQFLLKSTAPAITLNQVHKYIVVIKKNQLFT